MASASTVAADRSLSLDDLNSVVRQQEQLLGPLVLIGNDGEQTLLSFDLDRDPPDTPITILKADTAPSSGAVIISRGLCFISGAKTDVVAYRPA